MLLIMDYLVWYWDKKRKGGEILGHVTARDIHENFMEERAKLDGSKLIQISVDGPRVNLKFMELVNSNQEENQLPQLVDIGSCSVHNVPDAFKTGAIKKLLHICSQIFHEVSVRRDDLTITGTSDFPSAFCGTRWIENKKLLIKPLVCGKI